MQMNDLRSILSDDELEQEIIFSSEEGDPLYESKVRFKVYSVISMLFDEINDLKQQLRNIKVEQGSFMRYKFQKLDKEKIKDSVTAYLKEIKVKTKEISVFEISQFLKIPADEVEEVLEELSRKGKVRFL